LTAATEHRIAIENGESVSALLTRPSGARACYVLAHGAGAGMRHAFMERIASGLAEREVASLRFNFPYMETGGKKPDRPALAHATVRAAAEEAARLCPGLLLVGGGKSFGGRMTSQAQSKAPMPGVRGLAFLGFPLHPANKPSIERAAHLSEINIPMLFLQGTRDALADLGLLRALIADLGPRATLHEIAGGDHSFLVLKKSGRSNDDAMREVLDTLAAWIKTLT
jgi:hypothetical protein